MMTINNRRQVIVEYLIGGDNGDPTSARDTTLAAIQEAKKKPAKFKLAEVLGNLVLNPDPTNSWNAVRSLRSMAAVVVRVRRCCVKLYWRQWRIEL